MDMSFLVVFHQVQWAMQCQAKPRGPVIDGRFGQSRFVPEKEFSLTE